MYKVANFKELGENLDVVLNRLLNNPKLCKLLYYDNSNPLASEDIEATEELLFTKIFPYPRTSELLEKASSMLIVGFDNFKSINSSFVGSIFYVRILCHQSLWRLDVGGLRPYLIINEIANLFNKQEVLGIGDILFDRAVEIREGQYLGFELVYKITEFN